MNLLYVGIGYQYINPTPSLLPVALSRFADLYCYGPGYSSPDTLRGGLDRFAASLPSVDLVLVTNAYAGDYAADRLNRSLSQFPHFSRMGGITSAILDDVRQFLARHRERVVLSLLDSDIFAISQGTLDAFREHAGYFIGLQENCFELTPEAMDKEPYILSKKDAHTFGLYDDFSRAIHARRITLNHIIGEHEFSWNALALRRYDVSVPGNHYFRRGAVYDELLRRHDVIVARRTYEYAFKLAGKVGMKPYSNPYSIALYQLAFRELLRESKACVTDGGLINLTIRKFLEIPAAGSILVCWPTKDFSDIGFRDGVNCVQVDTAADAVARVREVARDPDSSQHIAAAGQRLVMKRHSVAARSRQIEESFTRILDGTFRGTRWSEGEFEFTGDGCQSVEEKRIGA